MTEQATNRTGQHDELLDASDFAALAKVTIRAVRRWDAKGIGPRPLRPPGARVVRYRRSEIEAWLNGEPVGAQLPPGGPPCAA